MILREYIIKITDYFSDILESSPSESSPSSISLSYFDIVVK